MVPPRGAHDRRGDGDDGDDGDGGGWGRKSGRFFEMKIDEAWFFSIDDFSAILLRERFLHRSV